MSVKMPKSLLNSTKQINLQILSAKSKTGGSTRCVIASVQTSKAGHLQDGHRQQHRDRGALRAWGGDVPGWVKLDCHQGGCRVRAFLPSEVCCPVPL